MSSAVPLLFSDGFDHYSATQLTAKGWQTPGNGTTSVVTGKYGGQAYRYSATSSGITQGPFKRVDPISGPSPFSIVSGEPFACHVSWRYSGGTFNASRPMTLLTSASGAVASVSAETSTMLFSIRNAAGTAVATGTRVFTSGVWYSLQLIGTVGASTTLSLYVNGVLECSANSVNTGTTTATSIGIGYIATSNFQSPVIDYDDLAVFKYGSAVGEIRIDTLYPAVAGTHTAWTANTGGTAAAVDDPASIDSDTTYISSNTVGDRSTFTVGALPTTSGTVYGVTVIRTERKDDTPTRQTAPSIVVPGTTYDGTTGPGLTTSYLPYIQTYSQRPDSVDWTVSDFGAGAVEFGTKVAT